VLIPQIILGGALIKYEEMNRNLDFIYTINRFFSTHPGSETGKRESALQVPWICEFMPMRWSYEALVVAQAKRNPLTVRQERLQRQINHLVEKEGRTPDETERLEDLKDALAMLSGLEAGSPPEIERRLDRIDKVIDGA